MSKSKASRSGLASAALAVVLAASAARAQDAARAELRSEASVIGAEVKLRQVLRWTGADAAFFAPVADVVVARFAAGEKSKRVDVSTVTRILEGAGMNRGELVLSGSTVVELTRLDATAPQSALARAVAKKSDKEKSLDEFLGEQRGGEPIPAPAAEPGATPFAPPAIQLVSSTGLFSVREGIYGEASRRVGAKREDVEITFEPGSERVLQLAEPAYKWAIAPGRYKGRAGLGQCSWMVTLTAGNESKSVEVVGTVHRWLTEVIALGGIASGEMIRDGDVEEKRVLVDRTPDDMLLSMETARTMEAATPIAGGTVITGRLVRRVMLVKRGQLVSIQVNEGAFQIRSVGRALDDGYFNQCINVINPESKVTLQVTVTGPQEARLGLPSDEEKERK